MSYSDLNSCMETLKAYGAAFYTVEKGDITELVHYSPYIAFDYTIDEGYPRCYVYNWKDRFDKEGKFIEHIPYEGVIVTELDESL